MKRLIDIIAEDNNIKDKDAISIDWINDNKPVQTKGGNQAIVSRVDISKIPNVVIGKVKVKDTLVDYEWSEDGICISAKDQYGNPKKPDKNDNLIKLKKI